MHIRALATGSPLQRDVVAAGSRDPPLWGRGAVQIIGRGPCSLSRTVSRRRRYSASGTPPSDFTGRGRQQQAECKRRRKWPGKTALHWRGILASGSRRALTLTSRGDDHLRFVCARWRSRGSRGRSPATQNEVISTGGANPQRSIPHALFKWLRSVLVRAEQMQRDPLPLLTPPGTPAAGRARLPRGHKVSVPASVRTRR